MGFFPFLPLSGPPSGAAGGGLTGTYPNPGLLAASVVAGVAGGALAPATVAATSTISAGGTITATGGSLDIATAGQGLKVSEGANGKQGRTAAMTAGAITVANTSVTASSEIICTGQTLGGTAGGVNISARTAGTSFTITSTNAADTSTVGFQMFEPG